MEIIPDDRKRRWVERGRQLLRSLSPAKLWAALSSGKASPRQRRQSVSSVIDNGRIALVKLCRSFADRTPSGFGWLASWSRKFADIIAPRHYAAAMAALSDVDPRPVDLAPADRAIVEQLGYIAGFQADVRSGRQPFLRLEGDRKTASRGFMARAAQYAGASWGIAETTVRDKYRRLGYRFERRVLGGAENVCPTCRAEAAKGLKPIGTLRAIGDSPCRSNCRCSFTYSYNNKNGFQISPLAM